MAVVIGIILIISGFYLMKNDRTWIGLLMVIFGCALMGAVAQVG